MSRTIKYYIDNVKIFINGCEFEPEDGDAMLGVQTLGLGWQYSGIFTIYSDRQHPRELIGRPIEVWGPPPGPNYDVARKLPTLKAEFNELYPDPYEMVLLVSDEGKNRRTI